MILYGLNLKFGVILYNSETPHIHTEEKITGVIEVLKKEFGHDAGASSLIEKLNSYLTKNSTIIAMEKEIVAQTNDKFSFEFITKTNDAKPVLPKDFMDIFNSATLQLSYAFQIARQADLTPDQIAYLEAKVIDRTRADLTEKERLDVGYFVPTKEEVAENAKEVFEPMVKMVERINNAFVSKPFYSRQQIETLLANKRIILEKNKKIIENFDEEAEQVFDIEVAEQLALERTRLETYKKSGEIDKNVEISSLFDYYEDQLIYNIQMLEHRQNIGSPARQAYNHAVNENAFLESEIAELESQIADENNIENPEPSDK